MDGETNARTAGRDAPIVDADVRRRAAALAARLSEPVAEIVPDAWVPARPDLARLSGVFADWMAMHLNARGMKLPAMPPWLGRRTDVELPTKILVGFAIEWGPLEVAEFWRRLDADTFTAEMWGAYLRDGVRLRLVTALHVVRATRGSV